jgi:hypothetical protein
MAVDLYGIAGKKVFNGGAKNGSSRKRVTECERVWGPAAAASRVGTRTRTGPGSRHGQRETRVAVNQAGRGHWHT